MERRNGDIPAGGVGGSAGGFPLVDGSDGKVGRLKRDGGATGRDPGSGGGGIGSIARVAHPIEHQLLPGIELEAEPVPTFLIFAESRGGEFVIEPRESLDRNLFATEFELARGLEAGEGVVVAGVAGSGGFSAEAFFALIGEGFEGSGGKF